MLHSEIIAVCSEIHTKHISTLCGQNVEFVNVKPGGTYSNHWDLKVSICFDVAEENVASIFRVTGFGSGGCWSDLGEEMCLLCRKVASTVTSLYKSL
jgi:hypothetical protein